MSLQTQSRMRTRFLRSRSALGSIGQALLAAALLLAAPAGAPAQSPEEIQPKINQLLKRAGIRSTDWGMEITDPDSGQTLVSVNPDKPFLPASVIKVVTTAAALEKLGPEFTFRTGVYTNGVLNPDGTLEGDLILVGRGDPNLGDGTGELLTKPALALLAENLEALGLRRIQGDIVGDDSYFDHTTKGKGWTARDLRLPYGAPISALSYNNNVFWVHARPTKAGQLVRVSLEPSTSYFRIRNLATTSKAQAKKTIGARVTPGTNRLVVSGILPASRTYSGHVIVEKPAEAVATLFQEELQKRHIAATGKVRVIRWGDLAPESRNEWTPLAEHQSPPLIRALEIINKTSENLHAEMLLRVLGAEFRGAGTDEAGLEVVREFLLDAGIEQEKVSLSDGSGLSRENLLTPRFQTSLLLFLSSRPYFNLFLNTLAVSGTDGTLKNRLTSEQVKGVIHAKTGTLNGVATLSGFMTTQSGRNLVFSIFANNARTSINRIRSTIDEICAFLVRFY